MHKVYVSHNNIISALGNTSEANVDAIANGTSGITKISDENLLPQPFFGSRISKNIFKHTSTRYTWLEGLMIQAIQEVLETSGIEITSRTGLVISTTKGNIDALDAENPFPAERAYLSALGRQLQEYFKFQERPIIVSNACVSGILAVATAKLFIQAERYDEVIVVVGDILSKFVLSGFQSFQAMSDMPCKPYDKNRIGINIGEAVACILVTKNENNLAPESLELISEASCNDANHISGPSRTGEGLYKAISRALNDSKLRPEDIDYISAHGTATIFNDEMEAVAFNRLDLQHIPLNSLKGYYGHSLGTSALVETIIGMHSLYRDTLFASKGYETSGVSKPLNIITETTKKPLNIFLKTASGFGGCNTALILGKPSRNDP